MKILVRLPNHLGDVIMALGALDLLHRRHPAATLHVIATTPHAALMARLPYVQRVFPLPAIKRTTGNKLKNKLNNKLKALLAYYQYARLVRKRARYDYFFCFPNSFSAAWMGYWIGARHRVGYAAEARRYLLTHAYADRPQHYAARYAYLVHQTFGPPTDVLDMRLPVPLAKPHLTPYAVVCMVSANTSRTVPLPHAIAYLQHIIQWWKQPIFFVGTAAQRPYYAACMAAMPTSATKAQLHNHAGRTSLGQLVELIAHAEWVLTTDTGTSHLANSLCRPLVVTLGAGNPDLVKPYPHYSAVRVLQTTDFACVPCGKNTCKYGDSRCLLAISPPSVSTAIQAVMDAKG